MMRRLVGCVALLILGVSVRPPVSVLGDGSLSAADPPRRTETALDRYVKAPDASYRYEQAEVRKGEGHTAYVLRMTSQTWLTPREVDRPEWWHWLTVVRPDPVRHGTGLVFVTGGDTRGKPPGRLNPSLIDLAVTTQSIVAELRMVPNQPVVFATETRERVEDDLIAYTWDKFLRTGNDRWPARLPMTKAVVRAMDTVTNFCARPEQGGITVDKFVVSGASKRGWTTWMAAAVDSRVVAIVPLVIDVLNVERSFVHHWQAYGFWAPAVKEYEDMGIMRWMLTPQNQALLAIEDPYAYRDRLTVPKFIINSTGDQFFLPDSWRFYFADLPGEKHLRYVPNTDHSLRNSDGSDSLGAFYSAILTGTPRPQFAWKTDGNGRLSVVTSTAPTRVTFWQATNTERRDFRLEKIGPAFMPTLLESTGDGTYEAQIATPARGWTAGLIELRYPSGTKYPFVFTTGVVVVPETMPFSEPVRTQE